MENLTRYCLLKGAFDGCSCKIVEVDDGDYTKFSDIKDILNKSDNKAMDAIIDKVDEYINSHWESEMVVERLRSFAAWCRQQRQ